MGRAGGPLEVGGQKFKSISFCPAAGVSLVILKLLPVNLVEC